MKRLSDESKSNVKQIVGVARPDFYIGGFIRPAWVVFIIFLSFIIHSSALIIAQEPAPEFNLKVLFTEKRATLNSLLIEKDKRNVLVLSFFDTTCEPCLKEMPHLHNLAQKYQDKDVKFYLVSIDRTTAQVVEDYTKKNNVTLPVLLDPYGIQTGEKYGVVVNQMAKLPKLCLISKNGYIKKFYEGYQENLEEVLSKEIDELLLEKAEPIVQVKKSILTVLFTNSTNGYLESCDCPDNPFGGLARRTSLVNDIKKDNPNVLLLDSGDVLPPYPDVLLAKYTLLVMEKVGYDLVALGDQEFILGTDYLKSEIEKSKLPFHSANLTTCQGETCTYLAPSHLIKNIGDLKVGIISVISPKVFNFFPKDKIKDLKVLSSTDTVQGFVDNFRKEVDLIIVISHSGYEEDIKLAKQISGIDLIIGGHSQTLVKNPSGPNNTLIVQTGEKGQYLGKLDLKFDEKKKVVSHTYQLFPLTKDIPDNQEVRALITEYQQEIEKAGKELLTK